MFINPHHKIAFAVDPIDPILAAVRRLAGLPAKDRPGGVMVAAIEQTGLKFAEIERTGERLSSDIILGRLNIKVGAAPAPVFAMGVRLHWKYMWHPRFYLWLPRADEPAVFVPAMGRAGPCFRIEDHSLFADQNMPFATMDERQRGILDARAALSACWEG
ncbi:hypothetical protein J2Y54_002209 [Sphingomonas sp. BE123]|uniref:hypothetical protein n=1 Tax=Sphingomonas sp. BE123 TaxID=2817842 RepID=UPI002860DF24|nr:hypothetical protein [Sphingomonas sp. BE123]MDR6852689.1 hypothetical protein [Sphingomonas sp. BE123]